MTKEILSPGKQIDDARRQGQFEGEVRAMLTDIKTGLTSLNSSYSGLEGRVRVVETGFAQLTDLMGKFNDNAQERVKDSQKAHDEMTNAQTGQGDRIRKLEDFKIKIVAIAAGVAFLVDIVLRVAPTLINSFKK